MSFYYKFVLFIYINGNRLIFNKYYDIQILMYIKYICYLQINSVTLGYSVSCNKCKSILEYFCSRLVSVDVFSTLDVNIIINGQFHSKYYMCRHVSMSA